MYRFAAQFNKIILSAIIHCSATSLWHIEQVFIYLIFFYRVEWESENTTEATKKICFLFVQMLRSANGRPHSISKFINKKKINIIYHFCVTISNEHDNIVATVIGVYMWLARGAQTACALIIVINEMRAVCMQFQLN